jgi:hypothetical protein
VTLTLPLLPTSELVTLGWIKDVVTAYDVATGTTLQGPDPETGVLSWGTTGFVQAAVVGGAINGTVPLRRPTMSVDAWAVNVNGARPPWGRANAICELIVQAAYAFDWGATQRAVTLPKTYGSVLVREGTVLTEPERRPADAAGYAHYGFQLNISWLSL